MTNREIIAKAAVEIGMITQEKAKEMLLKNIEIPLHTIGGWRSICEKYKIKDNERGTDVKIWKKKEDGTGFYLAKAKLYREEQLYIEE